MKNGLPYYKAYPRDFIEGTIGMSFEMKGAYRIILDLIYMQGGRLPDDARYISGLLGCSIRKWKTLRSDLIGAGKIHVSGEFLANYRADKELETLAKLQETKRENRSGSSKNNKLKKRPSDHTEPEPEPDIYTDSDESVVISGEMTRGEIAQAVTAYNETAAKSGWPSVRKLTKARKSALGQRLREVGLDGWRDALDRAAQSPHLCGQNERGWVAGFDFLTRQSSFNKLIEGNYDPKKPKGGSNGKLAAAMRAAERFRRESGMDSGPDHDPSQPLLPARRGGGSDGSGNDGLDSDSSRLQPGGAGTCLPHVHGEPAEEATDAGRDQRHGGDSFEAYSGGCQTVTPLRPTVAAKNRY